MKKIDFTIDKSVFEAIPSLTLGVISCSVNITKYDNDLWQFIDKTTHRIANELGNNKLEDIYEISKLRDGYKKLGKNPSRYRGSAESLLRRIVQGKNLYRINTVVDINNLLSIETFESVGSYNLDKITFPVSMRVGFSGESYKGIGKELINIESIPIFVDEHGPFGSPTSDSERAMITCHTKMMMMVIISFSGNNLSRHLQRGIDLLKQHSSASNILTQIVDNESSRKHLCD